jgi:HSP20 family protein
MKIVKTNQLDPMYPSNFSSVLDKFFNDSFGAIEKPFNPAVDIAEDEKNFEIHVAVPGVQKKDFKVEFVDGKLNISGERKLEEKKEGKNFHSIESQYGSFKRSFFLPEDVKADAIEATYEDGLLKVLIPKKEKTEVKKAIEVK